MAAAAASYKELRGRPLLHVCLAVVRTHTTTVGRRRGFCTTVWSRLWLLEPAARYKHHRPLARVDRLVAQGPNHLSPMPRRQKPGSKEWLSRQADIDAYCAFRRCHLARDRQGKKNALSDMSSDPARRCAVSLAGDRASDYAAKLDRLLAVPGLREGFWLKSMHKVRNLGIEEVKSPATFIASY